MPAKDRGRRCAPPSWPPIRTTPNPGCSSPRGESITVLADRSRHLGSFDPFRREMHLGVGCAIENLMRAASVYGFHAECHRQWRKADAFARQRSRKGRASLA